MSFQPKIQEKSWDPQLELELLELWEKERLYTFDPSAPKRFSIDTPPPYPSGRPWHIGAAAHYSQIDMIARTARMMGYSTYFPMGIDRNGLPVELYTERKHGISIRDVSRERFLELCSQSLDELEEEMIKIMKRMGLSAQFEGYYRTDSEEFRALTQATFIELYRKGLIYRAKRPNNYCPDCNTTIADAEVLYEDRPSKLVYMRFPLEKGGQITIASTRPELLCACQAVLVNPEDGRYQSLHGERAQIPLYGRLVPIIPHPSARPEFGSGAVMVCSYGDHTDVILFRELGLEEIVAISEEGRMMRVAGPYEGLTTEEARSRIIEDLRSKGYLERVERIIHRTPVCERSRTPIEIIPMEEYYLKQLDYLEELRRMAQEMRFHPEEHRTILLNWLKGLNLDWPISRRRYYATEIPIWYCKACGEPHLPEPGRYYRPWKERAPFSSCTKCGGEEFVGEWRTFDTWMDSSITPLFIAGYGRDEKLFNALYPVTLRPQAKDIVRSWLHYTLLRCYQLTSKPPFERAWIMGYGVDEKGERMSKSRGNVIDPFPILERYGADTFRLWSASEASLGSDFRCSEAKIAGTSKFLTKLWNLARFISSFPIQEVRELYPTDRWIRSELNKLIRDCLKGYEEFNFFIPANRVRDFTWNLFAPHYVEMVKPRAYGSGFSEEERASAWATLHKSLQVILKLLAPITPFICDLIWRRIYGKGSIHVEPFPQPEGDDEMARMTPRLVEFNSTIWALKKRRGISLKEPIEFQLPEELKPFEGDLVRMHNLVLST